MFCSLNGYSRWLQSTDDGIQMSDNKLQRKEAFEEGSRNAEFGKFEIRTLGVDDRLYVLGLRCRVSAQLLASKKLPVRI